MKLSSCTCAGNTGDADDQKASRKKSTPTKSQKEQSPGTASSSSPNSKSKKVRVVDQLPLCVLRPPKLPPKENGGREKKAKRAKSVADKIKKDHKLVIKTGRITKKKNKLKAGAAHRMFKFLKKKIKASTKVMSCCCPKGNTKLMKNREDYRSEMSASWKLRLRPRPLKSLRFNSFKHFYTNASNSIMPSSGQHRTHRPRHQSQPRRSVNGSVNGSVTEPLRSISQLDLSPIIDLFMLSPRDGQTRLGGAAPANQGVSGDAPNVEGVTVPITMSDINIHRA